MPTPLPYVSWPNRVWREFRVANLTRTYRDVLLTLATFRGHGGLCVPSHETLAARAGCCVRTVRRALVQARQLGLVDWCERRVRAGWRWLRTSNSYRLGVPSGPVKAGLRPPWPRRSTTGQNGTGEERGSKKAAWEEMWLAAAAIPDLLAMRRETFRLAQG
jgi:Helix-turn-helix domain